MSADIHLIPVRLASLRPTQIPCGHRDEKRAHRKSLGKKARTVAIESHGFRPVLRPKGRYYTTDHHNLGLALLVDGVKGVNAMPLTGMSKLDGTTPSVEFPWADFLRPLVPTGKSFDMMPAHSHSAVPGIFRAGCAR